jgi:hypothetical protein
MLMFRSEWLWLVPIVLSVTFLLWVLWGMHKDSKRY